MLLHLLLQTSYLYLVFALPQRVDRINQGPASAAQILSQTSDISPDGTYITSFETSNGISYQEQGQPKAIGPEGPILESRGQVSWITEDGQTRLGLTWLADENGFQPQGEHLPTPPPIPALIQRALAWIAANPGPDSQPDDGIRRVPIPVRSYVTNNNYTATTFAPTAVPVVVPLVNQPAVIQPSLLQQRRPPPRTRLPVVPFGTLPQ